MQRLRDISITKKLVLIMSRMPVWMVDHHCDYSRIDPLKIDHAFLKNIPDDKVNAAIVSALITLAHSLGFSIIAEGIENNNNYNFSRSRLRYSAGVLFKSAIHERGFKPFSFRHKISISAG